MKVAKALLIIASLASFEVAADSKFCVVTNSGQSSCIYHSIESCQSAARTFDGICSVNQAELDRPPVRFDPGSSYNKGYSSGAEDGRRLREMTARNRAENRSQLPIPENFVGSCRAWIAVLDGTAANIYGHENLPAATQRGGMCIGYIGGYYHAFKMAAEQSGMSCSASLDTDSAARQIAAMGEGNSIWGQAELGAVSRFWCN